LTQNSPTKARAPERPHRHSTCWLASVRWNVWFAFRASSRPILQNKTHDADRQKNNPTDDGNQLCIV
jgi:hypothetical protein